MAETDLGNLVVVFEEICRKLPDADALRTDHPLQGQTFGGIVEALSAIADALTDVASAIREHGSDPAA